MSIDREQRYICNQQRKLFEYVQHTHADVFEFANQFMRSNFCNRSLDKVYSVDQFADIVNWIEFLQWENIRVTPVLQITHPVSQAAAGWLGFTYRQIQILTRLQSRDIADKIPIDRLYLNYAGLHTVSEDMAAEIILKDFNIQLA